MSTENKFYACEPQYWLFLSKFQRKLLGWITLELFTLSFFGLPACIVFFIPWFWRSWPVLTTVFFTAVVTSMLLPRTEWMPIRKLFQLWYEIFDVSCNLSPEQVARLLNENTPGQTIQAMHPHGVVPFQGALWASYCDQHLHDPVTGRSLYGFSGMASIVQYAPFLRNIVGWLSGVPADYAVLKRGLMKGETPHCALSAGRKPRHLFVMPGGVAEIFVSKPGKHAIVFKSRKGLCKLSIETGAKLLPTYVFGGNEFFHNLTKFDGMFSHLSRMIRAGVTFFWGRWGLPIPFTPKVTMVVGEPIPPPTEGWDGEGPVPSELIDKLHQTYIERMVELFDRYKGDCGCPDAVLEIL